MKSGLGRGLAMVGNAVRWSSGYRALLQPVGISRNVLDRSGAAASIVEQ